MKKLLGLFLMMASVGGCAPVGDEATGQAGQFTVTDTESYAAQGTWDGDEFVNTVRSTFSPPGHGYGGTQGICGLTRVRGFFADKHSWARIVIDGGYYATQTAQGAASTRPVGAQDVYAQMGCEAIATFTGTGIGTASTDLVTTRSSSTFSTSMDVDSNTTGRICPWYGVRGAFSQLAVGGTEGAPISEVAYSSGVSETHARGVDGRDAVVSDSQCTKWSGDPAWTYAFSSTRGTLAGALTYTSYKASEYFCYLEGVSRGSQQSGNIDVQVQHAVHSGVDYYFTASSGTSGHWNCVQHAL